MKITVSHFFKYQRHLSGCFALLLLSSVNLFAQSDTSKTLKEVNVNTGVHTDGIIPSQQVSNKDFLRYGAFTVADAIRNFTGVNIKDYGGIGGLKTISVRSLGANHTAVLFDGVQVNDAQTGQIDLSKFALNNIAEIVLYNGQPENILQPARSFASASLLSIQTIKPGLNAQKPYQIQVGANGGSFGLINPFLYWQQRINNQWAFTINTNYIAANGKYKYKNEEDGSDTLAVRTNGDVRSLQTQVALYWAKNDSNKFNFHINYYNSKRGLPGAAINYNPYTNERIENNDIFIQTGYQHTWQNSLQLLLNAKLSQLKTRYLDPDFLNAQGFTDQHYNQREFYQSAALAYHITAAWQISYAIDVSFLKQEADIFQYAYPSRFSLLNVLATSFTKGIFKLEGNVLYTNINETAKRTIPSRSRNVFSPTIIASVKPFNNNLQVRAFYKSIFRMPTLDELYFYAVVPRSTKPEFVKQYNLGLTWAESYNGFLKYIALTTNAYYNNVTDKILALPSKNPAIFSFSNIGKVDIKGVDFGLKSQTQTFNKWYGLFNVNYTYQQAINADVTSSTYNEQLPYTPQHTVAINGGLVHQKIGVYYNQVLSSYRYYGENNTNENYLPGYSISDASVVYDGFIDKLPFKTSFAVNNLFNTNYAIIRSYPMPGRSYRLSIQITI
jgi:vitamin B12 transporter